LDKTGWRERSGSRDEIETFRNWESKMKTRCIACGVVALSAAFGADVQGQEPPVQRYDVRGTVTLAEPSPQTAGGGGRGGFTFARVPVESKLVKGAPYNAEVVTESVQTLADGNRIVRKTTGRVYRDSQGRTRREDDREPGKVRTISIVDPVGGFSYSLNPENRIAWKTPYRTGSVIVSKISVGPNTSADPAAAELRRTVDELVELRSKTEGAGSQGGGRGSGGVAVAGRGADGTLRATVADEKIEKLPAQQIEGVTAEGVRTTRTIPAGAIGNEQPIAIVTEEWRSLELQVLVLTRTSDPRTGESTYKLLGIQRSEPNASWFEVPGDYTVRDSGVPGVIRKR
jgi:hypothetical protein